MSDEIPTPPDWLQDKALDRWNSVWPTLDRTRVNPATHGDLVVMYCRSYQDYREQDEYLSLDPDTAIVTDTNNRQILSPRLAVRDKAMVQMMELAKILGIRPDEQVPSLPMAKQYAATLLTETEIVDDEPARLSGVAGNEIALAATTPGSDTGG